MSTASTSNKWSLSTGFAFWGVTVQTVFSLIGTTLLMYIIYNAYDLFFSALVPYVGSKDFEYFESVRQKYFDSSIACFVIAAFAYIFYLVGIYMWKGAQRSIKSDMHVRDIILAEFIMPVEVIIFYMIYKTSPELIENWDSAFPILLCAWAAIIVAVILLLVQFKSLSKEETWSEKARKGADDLRFSYSLVLWIQGVLILGFLLIFLTVYSTISKFQSVSIDKFGNTITNTFSVAQEMQNVVGTIKVIMMVVCLIVSIFAFILTMYRIMGWYKIKVSGNEEAYQFASEQIAYVSPGRFCHKCGMQLPEGSAFCPGCGIPVATVDEDELRAMEAEVVEPEADSQPELPSADITVDYDDEESDSKKKWMLRGGVAAGVLVVAAAIWAFWGHNDKFEPNAKIYADRSIVFKNVEDGVGIEAMEELIFGTPIERLTPEQDVEGKWVRVSFESDGRIGKGYMSNDDMLDMEDFDVLYRAGLSDGQARFHLPFKIQRLAVLDAVKNNGSDWHLEGIKLYGERQPNAKRLSVRGTSPSGECLGFIMRDSETNERKFFLYSIPDSYNMEHSEAPVFLYSETPRSGEDVVYDAYYRKKGNRYEVIYKTMTEDDGPDSSLFEVIEVPAEEEVTEYTEEKQYAGEIEFNGHVDGKYPVRMVLAMHDGGAVSGTVTYLKYNVPMELTGTFTDSGDYRDLSLEERSEGKTTGNFIGRYDGKVLSGSWVSADGAKEMPFRVER